MARTKWKPVTGFESRYLVSNGGRIKSFSSGKILTQWTTDKGYKRVHLWNGFKKIWKRVHILVAVEFCENDDPINKTEVNHLFGKKWDNRSSQLEWTTRRENLDHAKENGHTRGKAKKKRKSNVDCSLCKGVVIPEFKECDPINLSMKNISFDPGILDPVSNPITFSHSPSFFDESTKINKDQFNNLRRSVNDINLGSSNSRKDWVQEFKKPKKS